MAGLTVERDTGFLSLEKEHMFILKRGSVHFTVNCQRHEMLEMPLRCAAFLYRGFSNTEHISKLLVSVLGIKFSSKGVSLNLLLS